MTHFDHFSNILSFQESQVFFCLWCFFLTWLVFG